MLSKTSNVAKTIKDIFAGTKIESCIRRTKFRDVPLDIIKGSSEIEESDGDGDAIKNALSEIDHRYDYCVIDTHPAMQCPTIASIIAADFLIIPFKADGYGKDGLSILDDYINQILTLYNPDLRPYILVTQYANRKSENIILEDLVEHYNYPLLDTAISRREAVNSAILIRRPLAMHRKKDTVTQDYIALTMEVAELTDGYFENFLEGDEF